MPRDILVVRLGAMGDILHTLPAVATLRRSFPQARLTWLIEPRWRPLLEGNPAVDEIAEFNRAGGLTGMWSSVRALRHRARDVGIDVAETTVRDLNGRPWYLVEDYRPIAELL